MLRATLLIAGRQDRRSFARTLLCVVRLMCALAFLLLLAPSSLFAQPLSQRFLSAAHKGPRGETVSTTPHPAIARIIVPEKDGVSYGSGTLVDVRDDYGLVITNWHVVRDASGAISVLFPDGFSSRADVVKVDKDWDLAALSIRKPAAAPLPMTAAPPQVGERMMIAGYGSGDFRAAAGKCLGYESPEQGLPLELVEIDAEARHGDSGGPILNERGEVAGVLFGTNGTTHGSYGGRVITFLSSVLPGGNFASRAPLPANTIPGSPLVGSGGASGGVAANSSPDRAFAIAEPETSRQLAAMALHPTSPVGQPAIGQDQPLVPIPERRQPINPEVESTPPSDMEAQRMASTSRSGISLSPRLGMSSGQSHPAQAAPPSSRKTPAGSGENLEEASAVKLLTEVWRKVGGESVWDQTKAVLALVGILALVVKFWTMNGQSEPQSQDD